MISFLPCNPVYPVAGFISFGNRDIIQDPGPKYLEYGKGFGIGFFFVLQLYCIQKVTNSPIYHINLPFSVVFQFKSILSQEPVLELHLLASLKGVVVLCGG